MHKLLAAVFLFSLADILLAQEQPSIISGFADGSAPKTGTVRAAFKDVAVIDTKTLFEGGRKVTVQRLALDPKDPVKPAITANEITAPLRPQPTEAAQDAPGAVPDFTLIHFSAIVCPGSISRVSWIGRNAQGVSEEYSGWSNVDFNHFSGFNAFLGTDEKRHNFILAVANGGSDGDLRPPSFRTKDPTFIPDGKIPARELVPILSLHKLYEKEALRLAAAHAGRERARLAKEAEILANPPQPQDLTIRYRIAETPLPTPAKGGAQ